MPYPVAAVANSFLDVGKSVGEPIDPMKMQKLVYFAHGWHLGYGLGALSADHAQAWRWGPVFPELYHAVKIWGSGAIMRPVSTVEVDGGQFRPNTPTVPASTVAVQLIRRVWDIYGHMNGLALSQLTHVHGGPWQVVRERSPGERNLVIPNSLIREYFARKLQENAST